MRIWLIPVRLQGQIQPLPVNVPLTTQCEEEKTFPSTFFLFIPTWFNFIYPLGRVNLVTSCLHTSVTSLRHFDSVKQKKEEVGVAHCWSVWGLSNGGMSTITERVHAFLNSLQSDATQGRALTMWLLRWSKHWKSITGWWNGGAPCAL